ncbi:dihydropteroate synthase [Thioalbus denitrificans]|uniref:Dihydropteroate synthase n=1 Tax=Thioalbus denitrificans TaxID=547122 RepID=A0A369C971_9GAMM|nr:dihydropteroate synthase [Thioalbus denitrificans]RCX28334.1 dihydropteroate synthase [Thioalbus denitrificans]
MQQPDVIDCGGRPLDLTRIQVMGILNITPDSFSDGGVFLEPERAVAHGRAMVAAGAGIIDVGGESTRPGATAVSEDEELDRVIPVVEALSAALEVPVSVDTSKPGVMRAAVAAGAGLINDVYALREPGAVEAAAELEVPVCLMHMRGEPRTMQVNPEYEDVVGEVRAFLKERIAVCEAAGIHRQRLLADPGFGFGKSPEHNLALLRRLEAFTALGVPVLAGLSRKSLIGHVLGRPVDERLAGSIALAVLAATRGARILRVHDVAETVDAVRMVEAVLGS